jgi:poly(A) polymerase Pap1
LCASNSYIFSLSPFPVSCKIIEILIHANTYTCLDQEVVLLQDFDMLCDVDEATVRSLNGCRVADQILRLVPNTEVI